MSALRNAAVAFGTNYARKQFDGRKGHGGSSRVVHRQLSEAELAATAGFAFERGAEFAVAHMQADRERLVRGVQRALAALRALGHENVEGAKEAAALLLELGVPS